MILSLHLRKTHPIFPSSKWNFHKITLKGGHRTNNNSEGWNNRFSKFCAHKHPTIWNLIKKKNENGSRCGHQAKFILTTVGDYTVTSLGQQKLIKNRIKNVCVVCTN